MFKKLQRVFEDIADDFGYFLKRGSTFVLGKAGGQVAGEGVALALVSMLGIIGSFQAAVATTIAAAAVAGVSAALVQADFIHRRRQLVDRYREEVGSILQKDPAAVTEQDLEQMAHGDFTRGIEANSTIRQELKNSRLERNVGAILSTGTAIVTFLLIHTFNPAGALIGGALTHGIGDILTEAVSHPSILLKAAGMLGINGLAGFLTYHTIKTPLHFISEKLFDITPNTVNDQITDIKRTLGHGHKVSPEQVLGVFIQAHQDVAEQLQAQYGKDYEDMNRAERRQILSVIQQYMDIKTVTADINKGCMRPEELAFMAVGQHSGIAKQAEGTFRQHGNIMDGMMQALSAVTHRFSTTARPTSGEELSGFVGHMPGSTTYHIHTPDADHAEMHVENAFEAPGRRRSYVAHVARNVENLGRTQVERLQQSSRQEISTNFRE